MQIQNVKLLFKLFKKFFCLVIAVVMQAECSGLSMSWLEPIELIDNCGSFAGVCGFLESLNQQFLFFAWFAIRKKFW